MIFVVTGPSGCGKSTLIRRARESLPGLAFSVSYTTRAPRRSERPGVDYHFVTLRAFERLARGGRFVEWAEVHGHLYGTARSELERKGARRDVILDIDVQGARQVRARLRRAVQVFVMPPRYEELRRRLLARKEDEAAAIERRLGDARGEIAAFTEFDYVVINDDLERAADELCSIITASRCRPGVRAAAIAGILGSFPRPGRAAAGGRPKP